MAEWDANEATQIRAFPFVGGDRILVADADLFRRNWLRHAVGGLFGIEEVDNARSALERLTGDPPKILVVGSELIDISGGVLLAHAARHGLVGPHRGPVVFLLADTPETAPQVDERVIPIFYRLTPTLQPDRARELMNQALARSTPQPPPIAEQDAHRNRLIVEQAKRLGSMQDLKSAATAAIAAVIDVVGADRARCLYYDDERGALWSETDDGSDEAQASAGIAGFAVRTGSRIGLARAGDDPAYRPHVDDPAGNGNERLAVQPVADRNGQTHAVLIAVREPSRPEFSHADLLAFSHLADAWAPYIHTLAIETEVQASVGDREDGEIFRQQAIDHMVRRGHSGDVVRIHPGWVSGAFWIVILAVGGLVGFAAVAEVHQYASGPAVVKVTGRNDLITYDGGSVTAVEVTAGQEVTQDQVLIRLHDTEQAGRMRALEAEFERKLVAYLQTPADKAAGQALGAVVSERENAQANLDARLVKAPHAGVVKEILCRTGQRIEAGAVVISISQKDVPEGLSVIAFLAGSERPRLRANQQLRLSLPGYRGAYLETEVFAISGEVLGAEDARARYLGAQLGDSFPIKGTVVVVEARLESRTFESDDEIYELRNGMVGLAEVRLESHSILSQLFPGLE